MISPCACESKYRIGRSCIWAVSYTHLDVYKRQASGWALTFVFPSAILAMVLATIILMIVNIRNWQSYMMMQLRCV